MDALDIINYLADLKTFRGVYPANCIPTHISLPGGIVINTDDLGTKGEHWVAYFVDEAKTGSYFDSFGLPPIIPSILEGIENLCTVWNYNKCTLQSFTSETCAHYCIMFLECKSIGLTSEEICSIFTKNTIKNDQDIINCIKQLQ